MKIAATITLGVVAILALFFLLLGALGIGIGFRVGGNLIADAWPASVGLAYLTLLALAAAGGIYLLWRGRGRAE